MPKKTKKQKLLAQLRRQLEITKLEPSVSLLKTEHLEVPKLSTNQITLTNIPTINDSSVSKNPDISHLKHDLLKTIALSGLAIGAQLCLYYFVSVRR